MDYFFESWRNLLPDRATCATWILRFARVDLFEKESIIGVGATELRIPVLFAKDKLGDVTLGAETTLVLSSRKSGWNEKLR